MPIVVDECWYTRFSSFNWICILSTIFFRFCLLFYQFPNCFKKNNLKIMRFRQKFYSLSGVVVFAVVDVAAARLLLTWIKYKNFVFISFDNGRTYLWLMPTIHFENKAKKREAKRRKNKLFLFVITMCVLVTPNKISYFGYS